MSIKNLPESERPYEKFLKRGPEALTDADLLAIILKSGTKKCTSTELACSLLKGRNGNLLNLYDLTYEDLLAFDGIGPVKAIQLKAVAELAVRIASTRRSNKISLTSPASIADYYMETMRHLPVEHVVCAWFDVHANLLGDQTIFTGGSSNCQFTPKEIFDCVLEKHASCFIMLHNHPSGDPAPSEEDIRSTEMLSAGAAILQLNFFDHIIIGDNCYFSFREADMM